MRHLKIALLLLALALIVSILAACGARDKPPDNETPWPDPHSGVFVSDCGTLRFNGDGQSVRLDLSPELAEATGLPEGESEGTYVFLFSNGSWRYDSAENLRITVDGKSCMMLNHPGETDADHIVVYVYDLDGGKVVQFTRDPNQ